MFARRVLVVGDHVDTTFSLQLLLEICGHTVTPAYDGESAVACASQSSFDAVIIDMDMRCTCAFEVSRIIRRTLGENVLLIGITAWASARLAQHFRESGCDFQFLKPGDPDHIARLVATVGSPHAA